MTLELTLVSRAPCPYVQRAAIVLREKGVPFSRSWVDLSAKPDWFTALSPLGKMPVLVADGEPIFESAVICEYLDETPGPGAQYPARLLAFLRGRDGELGRRASQAWMRTPSTRRLASGCYSFWGWPPPGPSL